METTYGFELVLWVIFWLILGVLLLCALWLPKCNSSFRWHRQPKH